jgi:hypothetical protein
MGLENHRRPLPSGPLIVEGSRSSLAMHKVFEIPEILQMIVEAIDKGDQVTQFRAALVSRAWCPVALRCLWKSGVVGCGSIKQLCQWVESETTVSTTFDSHAPDRLASKSDNVGDLTRTILRYASLVRELVFDDRARHAFGYAFHAFLLLYKPFCNLEDIKIGNNQRRHSSGQESTMLFALQVLGPSLRQIYFELSHQPQRHISMLFGRAAAVCANLRDLRLNGAIGSPSFPLLAGEELLPCFKHLQELELLVDIQFSYALLRTISDMPHITRCSLKLDQGQGVA